ncbi:MAG TPA: hypothetical protein VLA04_04235 [Verrucomicrobiae bacterium]|nr:hypothetical protein [Verrucomicrobiae bacterium]
MRLGIIAQGRKGLVLRGTGEIKLSAPERRSITKYPQLSSNSPILVSIQEKAYDTLPEVKRSGIVFYHVAPLTDEVDADARKALLKEVILEGSQAEVKMLLPEELRNRCLRKGVTVLTALLWATTKLTDEEIISFLDRPVPLIRDEGRQNPARFTRNQAQQQELLRKHPLYVWWHAQPGKFQREFVSKTGILTMGDLRSDDPLRFFGCLLTLTHTERAWEWMRTSLGSQGAVGVR